MEAKGALEENAQRAELPRSMARTCRYHCMVMLTNLFIKLAAKFNVTLVHHFHNSMCII